MEKKERKKTTEGKNNNKTLIWAKALMNSGAYLSSARELMWTT